MNLQRNIKPHHQRGIDNLISEYKDDPRFDAIIIGGSIAKGCARDDSDVDFMMVATDEEFEQRKLSGDFFINRKDLTDYPNGFVDGKIIDMDYLRKVAEKGNEPTRAAFQGVIVGFSKRNELTDLITTITTYPEQLRAEKLKSFYSMAFIQHWLMGEAERHDNLYTRSRAASQLVLFSGRLILAYNRVFFPYHKWFYEYLGRCPEKPVDLLDKMNTVLNTPNMDHATDLFNTVKSFQNWGVTDLEAFGWFMQEVELSWLDGQGSLEDW